LRKRGEANGLTGLRLIGLEELREIEPHSAGLQALVVPSTGITNYAAADCINHNREGDCGRCGR
jgi:(S)-2-hydroxyglutarate dehydrogenase